MRVLYLIDGLYFGGAERSLAAVAPRYAARGVMLDVAYVREREGVQEELRQGGAQLFPLAGPGGVLAWGRRVRDLVRERRPDVIHTTLFEADVVGRIVGTVTRVPVVSSLVNVAYGPEQLEDPGLRRWKVRGAQAIDALTARRAARFHALTTHVARIMSDRLRIPRSRIDVVPRGRDPEQLGPRTQERRAAARATLDISPETPLVLVAARQEYQKGLDVLLKAFPHVVDRVPDARLLLAGREGNQTRLLNDTLAGLQLGDAVRFLGPRGDVPDLLCAADVLVLPSRWEGLGSVLVEALALEAPIVASDLPPVRELLDDTALLVRPGQAEELAAGIVAALHAPAEARDRARRGRARFLERFTIERVADQMISFYERALEKRRVAA